MQWASRIELNFFCCCRCQYNISSCSCGWADEWERKGEEAWQHVFSPNSFLFITVKSNLLLWDSSQHIITLLNVFRHNNGDKIYFNLKLTVFSRRFSPYSTAIHRPYFFSRTVHPADLDQSGVTYSKHATRRDEGDMRNERSSVGWQEEGKKHKRNWKRVEFSSETFLAF